MSNVGAQLREAREAQNKSRAVVAGETGILVHELAALEYGRYDTLPDDETVAGFVKTYAEYLGFVPDEPVAEFWAERGVDPSAEAAPDDPPAPVDALHSPTPSAGDTRPLRWGWPAAALVIVLVIVWVATRNDPQPPAATEPAESRELEPAPAPDVPETPAGATERDDPLPVPAVVEPAPTEPETAPVTKLRIIESGVGTGVRDHRLVGASDRFGLGERVWFWTHVRGGGGEAIRHVWIHEGREISAVELDVENANWRTWSVKTLFGGSAGQWAVEARDVSGRVLARSEFVCLP